MLVVVGFVVIVVPVVVLVVVFVLVEEAQRGMLRVFELAILVSLAKESLSP